MNTWREGGGGFRRGDRGVTVEESKRRATLLVLFLLLLLCPISQLEDKGAAKMLKSRAKPLSLQPSVTLQNEVNSVQKS